MKKKFFFVALITASLFVTNYVFSNPSSLCPIGDGTKPLNGICVPIYAENGSISNYKCLKPDLGYVAPRDCYEEYSGDEVGDE